MEQRIAVAFRGSVKGFREIALPELRRAQMRGWTLGSHPHLIQKQLDRASALDSLRCQTPSARPGNHGPLANE